MIASLAPGLLVLLTAAPDIAVGIVAVACFAPSLAWLGYFYFKDDYPRAPLSKLLLAFGGGLIAGPLSLALYEGIAHVAFYRGLDALEYVPDIHKLIYAIFAIGLIEEVSKILVCTWFLRRRELTTRRPIDGIVYSSAVALGFATIENWYAMVKSGDPEWSRVITLPFMHVLFSALWGVAVGHSLPKRAARGLVSLGLVLSIVFHGIYDYILLSSVASDAMMLLLVLFLWVWMSSAAREAAVLAAREQGSH